MLQPESLQFQKYNRNRINRLPMMACGREVKSKVVEVRTDNTHILLTINFDQKFQNCKFKIKEINWKIVFLMIQTIKNNIKRLQRLYLFQFLIDRLIMIIAHLRLH